MQTPLALELKGHRCASLVWRQGKSPEVKVVIYFCVTNEQKRSCLKQQMFIISVSLGQEPRHGLAAYPGAEPRRLLKKSQPQGMSQPYKI